MTSEITHLFLLKRLNEEKLLEAGKAKVPVTFEVGDLLHSRRWLTLFRLLGSLKDWFRW